MVCAIFADFVKLSRLAERNEVDERSESQGCANHSLAAILEDISTDIDTFHAYLIGEDLAPGRLAEGRPP